MTLQKTHSGSIGSYLALILILLFFSGFFADKGALSFFDFNSLLGKFGTIQDTAFTGKGGTGARQGFIFALSLVPAIMLAVAFVELAAYYGALNAAQHLLTPLLRPLMGLPGASGLALISSLQSTDAGGAMTRELFDAGLITNKERSIFAAFQFSAGAAITNYLSTAAAIFPIMSEPILVPLGVILIHKTIGTNIMRIYLYFQEKNTKRA